MSSFLSELGGITAGVGAEGLAFAAGFAAAHALEPEAVLIAQDAWSSAQTRRLDPLTCAAVAAEMLASETTMATEASYSGIDSSRFDYLYHLQLTAPGTGELLTMLRRSDEVGIDFAHGLRKAKLETQWDAALQNLRWQRVSASDLAYMVVRGIVPDAGTLGSTLPTTADQLTLPPQHSLDTLTEAARTGWDADRFAMLVQRSGLAMAPVMAAQAHFRGILSLNDYELTIARGDLYPSFASPVLEVSRAIPSNLDFTEGHLRGWLTEQQMYDGAARHGTKPADTKLLYSIRRRPLSPHQIKQALARGGTFDTTNAPFDDPYTSSVHEANLGPEWYDLAVHLAGAYPSLFVTNRLVTAGTITPDTGRSWLEKSGTADEAVTAMFESWTAGGVAATDKHVTKAETSLWSAAHKSYIGYEIPDATATTALEAAGVPAATAPTVLSLWGEERSLIRKALSASNIKKAFANGVTNPATGLPWTQADATTRLLELGYSAADAQTYLEL